ncbi:MAG: WYL domain-containing protein [Erysipelotrichaceae bacterium]
MQKTKIALLAVYEILKKYTDDEHILSRVEICDLLDKIYQINIERRTFTDYIDTLIEFKIDISKYSDNGIGYYLIDREFEKSEVTLLCNAIYSSHFIPEKDSINLIKKLLSTQSRYVEKEFNNNVYVKNYLKTVNKEFFLNVEVLLDAIHCDKIVTFDYMKYDINKKLIPRKDHLYKIHPYYIIYANENYYLICRNDHYDEFSHYRIDRMKHIKICDERRGKLVKSFDPYAYAKSKIYMYGGKEDQVILKCSNRILNDIIDRFGLDTKIQKCDEESFYAVVLTSLQGITYFALQFLKYCEVLEPKSLRNEISEILTSSPYLNKDIKKPR